MGRSTLNAKPTGDGLVSSRRTILWMAGLPGWVLVAPACVRSADRSCRRERTARAHRPRHAMSRTTPPAGPIGSVAGKGQCDGLKRVRAHTFLGPCQRHGPSTRCVPMAIPGRDAKRRCLRLIEDVTPPWGNRLSGRYLRFRELQQPTKCADGRWNSWPVEDLQFENGLVWDPSASDRC